MTDRPTPQTVGQLPGASQEGPRTPVVLTRLVWGLWIGSVAALVFQFTSGTTWTGFGALAVDGLTVLMWTVVTFFSGIVHSYSRRYMRGSRTVRLFFGRIFGFTLVVMVLVMADHVVLFTLAWLTMGLIMADLIGHVDGWPQARAAGALARRYFAGGSVLVGAGFGTLWYARGITAVSEIPVALTGSSPAVVIAAGFFLVAAMVQSALVPFHTWLLSSMTAPTPASALMHAGFVNAGGILLMRVAAVMTAEPGIMLAVVLVGATSALAGKLLKSVQVDVKTQLGCSTLAQMGFMIFQAGLGFFGAAITHLILHGFYKAYLFLSSGSAVEHTSPTDPSEPPNNPGAVGTIVTGVTAVLGGAVFITLTGKGATADGGILLTGVVVLTTLHTTWNALGQSGLSAAVRYGVIPFVFLPAIAVYSLGYRAVKALIGGLPQVTVPAELTVVHGLVGVVFLGAYLAVETGLYQSSTRLYVAMMNATRPADGTSLTSKEEYNEY